MMRAQYLLGSLFEQGRGVEQDMKGAAGCFTDAARQSYAAAQFSLGVLRARAGGGKKIMRPPCTSTRRPRRRGTFRRCTTRAIFTRWALAPRKMKKKAVAYYTRAAQAGDADGQCSLAWCYDSGVGVPRDPERAVEWYKKAVGSSICGLCTTLHGVTDGAAGRERPGPGAACGQLFRRAAEG